MRSRNIKPGFFKNDQLAECSCWARLLFPGLWMLADREGRLEDRPKRIKGELLPFDGQDVEPLLQELTERGFIYRYAVAGQNYIQVLNFSKHQSPHHSEKNSVIKPPPLPEFSERKRDTPRALREDSQSLPAAAPSSRGGRNPLNPDCQIPDPPNPEPAVESLSRVPPPLQAHEAAERHSRCLEPSDERTALSVPSFAGRVCWTMKAAGVHDVNPSHPKLLELLGQDEPDMAEFAAAAQQAKARGKGFAYALAIVHGNRRAAVTAVTAVATRPASQAESFRERDRRVAAERMRELAPAVADRLASGLPPIVIDATPVASQAEARLLT